MQFCISASQLRRALEDIEQAERNGFMHCEAVFELISSGRNLDQCQAGYSDLYEKAHPTNPSLNWGRFQGITKSHKFVDGELKRIAP